MGGILLPTKKVLARRVANIQKSISGGVLSEPFSEGLGECDSAACMDMVHRIVAMHCCPTHSLLGRVDATQYTFSTYARDIVPQTGQ